MQALLKAPAAAAGARAAVRDPDGACHERAKSFAALCGKLEGNLLDYEAFLARATQQNDQARLAKCAAEAALIRGQVEFLHTFLRLCPLAHRETGDCASCRHRSAEGSCLLRPARA